MKALLLLAALFAASPAHAGLAASLNSPAVDGAWPANYPAHSWTYNLDFKDPEALAPFIGREVVDGQWKAGVRYDPLSVYRVDDAKGEATRWFRAGAMFVSNAEHLNATFGPHLGLEIFQFDSAAKLAGAGKSFWKPLGYLTITASVDVWGGWTPLHTSDVNHNYAGGFGFSLKGLFGAPGAASDAAHAAIKAGL